MGDKTRTNKQNAALHLMFDQVATELNNSGMYVGQVIKFDAMWNGDRFKELVWRPVQEHLVNKKSTTKLTTKEIDEIFTVIHRALSEKGIEIVFPSIEEIINKQRTEHG